MMRAVLVAAAGGFALLVAAVTPAAAAPAACSALKGLAIADTTITDASLNATGSFTIPGARPRTVTGLPTYCAVKGVITPTPSSRIQFEVWLPDGSWNSRLHVVGNGGLAGTISYAAMVDAVKDGFATASTDTGHTSDEPRTWLQDRERLIDYSSRGLHLTTVNAKALVQSYYTQPARWAYYSGCSTGGKQGLMEAQRYPADFNGILAGDAANFWTHQMASEVWNGVVSSSPETNLSKETLQLVEDRAIAACDALDGAADRLVSDPMRCTFDPHTLVCKGGDSGACLTPAQADAVAKIYSGPMNPLTGRNIYPGFYPGGEMGWAPGTVINRTTTSGVSSNDFFAYTLFRNPDWKFRTFDFAKDIERADTELAPITNATSADLGAFQRAGHKLLYYHGAADPLIPAQNGINYFESVVASQKGLEQTQQFFRAYLVPGLYHCSGGPGPIAFGTAGDPPAGQDDADHNAFKALQRWVESGAAPQAIIGTKYVDGQRDKGVALQRPLCPYPQVAIYNGSGDMNDAANFSCRVSR